jgi:two-component system, cell cycle sensor histidine kinase and response regulator CckA
MRIKKSKRGFDDYLLSVAGIVDSVSDPLVLLDAELRVVMASCSFYRMFEVSQRDVKGRLLYEVIQGNCEIDSLRATLEKVFLKNAECDDFEVVFASEKVGRRRIPVNISHVDDEDGRPLLIVLVFKGVFERKLEEISDCCYEEALGMFRFCINQAPEAVFWINREATFTYVNEQACRSLGYTREELLSLHLWDIDPVYPKEQWNSEWAKYQKDGQVATEVVETLHRRKDGIMFPVEVSAKHFWFGDTEFHVAFVRDITERKQVEQKLRLTQTAIDHASIACFWLNDKGRFIYVNEQACQSLGYTREELLQKSGFDIDPDFTSGKCAVCFQKMHQDQTVTFETTHQRKDGSLFPVEITANLVEFDSKEYSCTYARDITDLKRSEEEKAKLEMQLLQAHKMESVGRLAGGVAHDFNNMLSVILGYTELIKDRLPAEDPLFSDMLEIERAANNSRKTTRQLLAFSRKQIISPRPANLNNLLADTTKTLSRLIGENIDLSFNPQKDLWTINFDPSQVDQILVNLAVNARDAMPLGGKLNIETGNVHLDEAHCRKHIGMMPGPYVRLVVSDNGVGMDKDTLPHVFEPFFTTKEVDEGTGLGLATVYGIVKQNDGFIEVHSEKGQGTTFNIYLPGIMGTHQRVEKKQETSVVSCAGTILLVEDDNMVRKMTKTMLKKIGYTVLDAETPLQALSFCEKTDAPIDLLVSDVVMPEMSGPELSQKIKAIRPEIKVLFISGYTPDVIVQHGVLKEGVNFIQKPFAMNDLAQTVQNAIGDQKDNH